MAEQPVRVYGALWCPDCKRSKQFLNEQRIPYEWVDIERDESARQYVVNANKGKQIIPTIIFPDGSVLAEPSNAELADRLGLQRRASRKAYDLIVIGAGPAGLTSAIYAAREGLQTLVVEQSAVGGQAATTRQIENYPGFPQPIGGAELADRLGQQAGRFGVETLVAQAVVSLYQEMGQTNVRVQTGEEYCSYATVLATGSTYRRLGVPGESDFIGAGVHFCATCDGPFYKGKDIMVVGGGNSGFQEGLFLTRFARSVTILEAGSEFRASRVLQDKIAGRQDITAIKNTTVQEFRGTERLEAIVVRDGVTGESRTVLAVAVFVYIGMRPNTEFLKRTVELDDYGFITTRPNLETSLSGVFAAGDCRRGSTKQVASAVGEGATAALMAREHLERRGELARAPVEAAAEA